MADRVGRYVADQNRGLSRCLSVTARNSLGTGVENWPPAGSIQVSHGLAVLSDSLANGFETGELHEIEVPVHHFDEPIIPVISRSFALAR